MFEVTIYVETSFHGPSQCTAAGMYLIEYIKKDGTPETRQGMVCGIKMTENRLALEALSLAFDRLKESCSVRVFTRCEHILRAIGNFWLQEWEKNDWVTAKKKMVKNVIFWKKIAEAKRKHLVSIENGWNPYGEIMQNAMKKGLEYREKNGEMTVRYEVDLENMVFKEVKGE